ncbi:hypothetical protein [Glycomyces buryatensis]|uniref:MORN repeat protein n=1 Tax=Glycomyces buryatensis TaxID=2570927 RepID=A0A4S8QAW4_9ACTN|nr:hypothetical protein [Glycomyces buryatensis]THV41400.1 hypothetical protein FAB82_11405 [Glycomyces buryatensis]
MKPDYDPRVLETSGDDVTIDDNSMYWRGDYLFDGVLGEERSDGGFEFLSFKDGVRDGPTGEIDEDGDLVFEEWYRKGHLHGISRVFRDDGTLLRATGNEFGVAIWTVDFEPDGETARPASVKQLSESSRRVVQRYRSRYPQLPPVLGPEHAGDITEH